MRKPEYEIALAPGPDELIDASKFNIKIITSNDKAIKLTQLASLIKYSSYVISNDTGPAHMAAHLGKKGLAVFGSHTSPRRVSIETENFKAYQTNSLSNLSAEMLFSIIEKQI